MIIETTEEIDLEDILQQNYYCIHDPNSMHLVVDFIAETDSISERSIEFIKRLTKVAANIYAFSPDLIKEHLEKLYRFNYEGIEKLCNNGYSNYGIDDSRIIMLAHLYSHAGDAAKTIYFQHGDLIWAQRWYDSYRMSAETSHAKERKHAIFAYTNAANAAKEIFYNTREIDWLVRIFNLNRLSAELSDGFNQKHNAFANAHAGNAAYELFQLTGQDYWRSKAYSCYKRTLSFSKNNPSQFPDDVTASIRNKFDYLQHVV